MNEHDPMTSPKKSTEELCAELQKHPFLLERLEALLAIVNQEGGKYRTADEAEFALIDEVRKIGKETLTEWALHQHTKAVEVARAGTPEIKAHVKKK